MKQFQIELSAANFQPRKEELLEVLETFKVPVQLRGLDSVLYHENGKNDDEVILLSFANGSQDSKEIKRDFGSLIALLEKVFDETHKMEIRPERQDRGVEELKEKVKCEGSLRKPSMQATLRKPRSL